MDAPGYKSGKRVVHIVRVRGLHAGFLLNIRTVVGS